MLTINVLPRPGSLSTWINPLLQDRVQLELDELKKQRVERTAQSLGTAQ
ncbi:hypothetical protein [Paenibacillus montanisoli]|nr:hypothetical protein [Paenibacillus montanisoli]